LILPIITLAMVAIAYGVLLYVCEPFMSKSGKTVYNWFFIAGIVVSSAWLIMTWFMKCAPQVAAMESRRLRRAA
jgi:protein-S-isoprenylcysteine O-methyltransferase Ste14